MRPYLITAKLMRPSNMKRFPTPELDKQHPELRKYYSLKGCYLQSSQPYEAKLTDRIRWRRLCPWPDNTVVRLHGHEAQVIKITVSPAY
jgi:hypothetical protein